MTKEQAEAFAQTERDRLTRGGKECALASAHRPAPMSGLGDERGENRRGPPDLVKPRLINSG
jgi:hypothetical protein